MHPYIGELWLDQINNDSFNTYRKAREHLSIATRNAKIAVRAESSSWPLRFGVIPIPT
jgi:hypothetical protein